MNNVCFPLQINPSVITDSLNDFSAALQIKIFNHPVSISFCFAVIVPALLTSWCYVTHPSSLQPVAAGLGASPVSRFSKNNTTTKNLLTWRFEVLVVGKLWNKECELRAGSLCLLLSAWNNTSNFSEIWPSVQSTEAWTPGDGHRCPRSPGHPKTRDLLVQFVLVTSERRAGTSVAHFQLVPLSWWARAGFGPELLQVSTNYKSHVEASKNATNVPLPN